MIGSLEMPLVRIDSEVTRRVRQHARAHMQTEVCGVLVGKMSAGVIEIEAPIEAFTASQAGAHVTFTQAAWETIYKVKDKDYPEDRIVGWYHSHPGFGVFLSEYDTFIHRNFFSSPDQVAWVYDPHSDEEGCFGWVDGSIHRIANIHVADTSKEAPPRASQVATASQIQPATRTLQQLPVRPRLTSQALRTNLGYISAAGLVIKRGYLACIRLAISIALSIAAASKPLLRIKSGFAPLPRLGLDKSLPAPDTESGKAMKRLGSESGK